MTSSQGLQVNEIAAVFRKKMGCVLDLTIADCGSLFDFFFFFDVLSVSISPAQSFG